MKVELETHIGINLVTKKEQTYEQYRVFLVESDVNGDEVRTWVGIIGWAHGSKLIFNRRIDPIKQKFVVEATEKMLSREGLRSVQPSDIDPSILNHQDQEDDYVFDEEELT